ncbi:MAG: amidohydrolase [Clostridia bacterium]|nr:amidohydrolase [Clostridia bacterium]
MKILIKNADIITIDDERMFINNGNVAIENGYIKFVGAEADVTGFNADRVIDGSNKLVLPGLVNSHTHSPMTIFRNYADDLALEEWLFKKIIPAESKLTPEDVYWGAMLGITEMIKSGTTCFADMYLHMDEVVRAVQESGIRANISRGPIQSSVRTKSGLEVDADSCTGFFNNWNNKENGRIKVYVEIHSVYLFDEESIRDAAALAKQLNTGIHIHLAETLGENETSINKYGADPIEISERLGIFDVPVFAAHCVQLSDKNLKMLKERNVNVSHNPTSNLKLGSGIARVPEMLAEGINVSLGTDGTASNNNLNLIEEMHIAALIHKGVSKDPTLVNAEQVLKMATVNGAKAIGFGDETGVLKQGMKADVILIDMDKPHLNPRNNLMSAVVYSAQASDVDTVIIDGKIVMENRKLITIDEEKVKYKVNEITRRILGS